MKEINNKADLEQICAAYGKYQQLSSYESSSVAVKACASRMADAWLWALWELSQG